MYVQPRSTSIGLFVTRAHIKLSSAVATNILDDPAGSRASISRVAGVTNVNAPRRAVAPVPDARKLRAAIDACVPRMDTGHTPNLRLRTGIRHPACAARLRSVCRIHNNQFLRPLLQHGAKLPPSRRKDLAVQPRLPRPALDYPERRFPGHRPVSQSVLPTDRMTPEQRPPSNLPRVPPPQDTRPHTPAPGDAGASRCTVPSFSWNRRRPPTCNTTTRRDTAAVIRAKLNTRTPISA